MNVQQVERFRMTIDTRSAPAEAVLPPTCQWRKWDWQLLDSHARVLADAFVDELDAAIFPSLSNLDSCRELMDDIATRIGFLPTATWALECGGVLVGSIQGVINDYGDGTIQNVGVVRRERGKGLGRALVLRAIAGFRRAGIKRCTLEVTATNERALQMYRKLGFYRTKVTIKKYFLFSPSTDSHA